MKHAPGGPRLRNVCSQVLHRKCPRFALYSGIKFRQPIKNEIAASLANVTSDHGCLLSESIAFESQGDDTIVMRPDGSVLIGKWIIGGIVRRKRTNAPAAPHIWLKKSFHHASGMLLARNSAPQQMPRIRCNCLNLLLIAIERVRIVSSFLAPKELFESLPQIRGLLTQSRRDFGLPKIVKRIRHAEPSVIRITL